jgi:hypothetical protein
VENQSSTRGMDVFSYVLLAFSVLLIIWVSTAEGPKGKYYAYVFGYGPTITMMDRGVAEAYAQELGAPVTPGVHLVNKEGELVTPVRGGMKMAFKGLTGGNGEELETGLEGVRLGTKFNPAGMAILIIVPVLLTCVIAYRFNRRTAQNGALRPASGRHAQS